jgi:hypothetical protein
MQPDFPNPMNAGPPRFIGVVFGPAFFGIGLTALGFL